MLLYTCMCYSQLINCMVLIVRFCGVGDGKMVQLRGLVKTWNNYFPIDHDGALLQRTCLQEVCKLIFMYIAVLHTY